ncbi:MAG: hypothetical protein AB1445_03970 [Bacillota bacterium]
MKVRRALALVLAIVMLAVVAVGSRLFYSLVVVEGLLPGGDGGYLGRLCPEPTRQVIELEGARPFSAHLYLPARRRTGQAAVLSVPLAADLAENPGIVAAARSLARAGLVVLVPSPPVDFDSLLEPVDDGDLQVALEYLSGLPGVNPRRLGLIGVSYGSGPVLRVAASPPWRDRLAFVATLGSYYHLQHMVRYGTTGYHQYGEERYYRQPDLLVRNLMAAVLFNWLPDPADREQLLAHEATLLAGHIPPELAYGLSPGGAAMYRVAANVDDDAFYELYQAMPGEVRRRLDELSPASVAGAVRARAFLIHAREDAYVPFTESLYLYRALSRTSRPRLVLVGFLEHALPQERSAWELLRSHLRDALALLSLIYALLGT